MASNGISHSPFSTFEWVDWMLTSENEQKDVRDPNSSARDVSEQTEQNSSQKRLLESDEKVERVAKKARLEITPQAKEMDISLPLELWRLIFKNLDYTGYFKCFFISKKFRQICLEPKITALLVERKLFPQIKKTILNWAIYSNFLLRKLDLSGFNVTEEELISISKYCPNIQNFTLKPINDKVTEDLLLIPSLPKLTNNELKHLRNFSQLKSLNLENQKEITDEGLQYLASLSTLQSLNLGYCHKITDHGLQYLKEFINLNYLNLQCCSITTNGLKNLQKLSALQFLCLGRGNQDDKKEDINNEDGLQYLSSLSALKFLDLRGRKITDACLQHLKNFSNLEYLSLNECEKITDKGLQYLETLSSLKYLKLHLCNNISDNGIKHLTKLTQLQFLNLTSDNLTNKALKDLCSLSNLQVLSLKLKDDTNEELMHLKRLLYLNILEFWNTKINGAQIESLLKSFPRLEIGLIDCDLIDGEKYEDMVYKSFNYAELSYLIFEKINKKSLQVKRCNMLRFLSSHFT